MTRHIRIATLAFTLPFSALAQSKSPASLSEVPPATATHATEDRPTHTPRAYAVGTDCGTILIRTERNDCAAQLTQNRLIHLNTPGAQNDANEILVAVRNLFDPGIKVYLVAGLEAIAIATYPQELDRIEAFIHELDRPRHTYRLTYTLTELDGGKRIGTQHFSMIAISGQHTSLKQGSKIPVATGSYNSTASPTSGAETQFTYLDVGMNFSVTLDATEHSARLTSKVEQSSVATTNLISGVQEPVIRQAVLEGVSLLVFNKPLMLGSMDVPDSTRRIDIEVVAEQVQ